jgi:COMPASS component SPP1
VFPSFDGLNRWQAVRRRDVEKEKECKEEALMKLTTKEREIRKRIEDMVDPLGTSCNQQPIGKIPLKSLNGKLANGHATKGKMNGDSKKGKKRKVPS